MAELEISEAYCYDCAQDREEEINGRVIVNFRPKEGWKGKGYGFDWMRIGDYKLIEPDSKYNHTEMYEKIVSKQYVSMQTGILKKMIRISKQQRRVLTNEEKAEIQRTTQPDLIKNGVPYMLEDESNNRGGNYFTDEASFKALEREYKCSKILAKPIQAQDGTTDYEKYYCSWLSLYPTKSAKLSLIIEVLDDKPYTLDFSDGCGNYTISKLQPIDNLPKGKHIIKDAIEVISNRTHSDDCTIYAELTIEGRNDIFVSGFMRTWANDTSKHKKAKIIMVNVKTMSNRSGAVSQLSNIGLSQIQEDANDFLNQMFIEIDDAIELDVDVSDKREFKRNGDYYCSEGVLIDNKSGAREDKVYRFLDKESKKEFDDQYPQLRNQYNTYLRIFFIDQLFYDYDYSARTVKKGGHGSVKNNPFIIFSSDIRAGYELAHEISHSFKLEHTFANKEYYPKAEYTYEGIYTDNIMDYTELAYSKEPEQYKVFQFWHWQWKIANGSVR